MLQLNLILNADSDTPLYRQLYNSLAQGIRRGELAPGTRLPGKRSLAAELGISVNTVDTAYQMLTAEGFVDSRPRSGFVVQDSGELVTGEEAAPTQTGAAPLPLPRYRWDLSTAQIATDLFPARTWQRIQRELLYRPEALLGPGRSGGEWELREQLAQYLAAYRGVTCQPEQVIIGAGVEYLLALLAGLLPEAIGAVEDPGYSRARIILENNGVPCRLVPVDEGGLSIRALQASGASLCYVTPSHQFPTGVTMPVGRRAELLRWAAHSPDRYIIEDDYDSEFRFDVRPLPSLQGMAGSGDRVIYLSTFSRCLAPGIRIAYMVLPQPLLTRYRARYGAYSCTVGRMEQLTLARFMQQGDFTRHLGRMRSEYKRRRTALTEALNRAFGEGRLQLAGLHTGIHLLLSLPEGPGEAAMVSRAGAAGIRLAGLSEYYHADAGRCPPGTVVIGYGALPCAESAALAAELKRLWT